MKLKYRILETNKGKFSPEYFEGFWIFGTWKRFGRSYKKLKNAEEYVIQYAHTVFASRDKVIRKITVY